jgi:hypothetical protein
MPPNLVLAAQRASPLPRPIVPCCTVSVRTSSHGHHHRGSSSRLRRSPEARNQDRHKPWSADGAEPSGTEVPVRMAGLTHLRVVSARRPRHELSSQCARQMPGRKGSESRTRGLKDRSHECRPVPATLVECRCMPSDLDLSHEAVSTDAAR